MKIIKNILVFFLFVGIGFGGAYLLDIGTEKEEIIEDKEIVVVFNDISTNYKISDNSKTVYDFLNTNFDIELVNNEVIHINDIHRSLEKGEYINIDADLETSLNDVNTITITLDALNLDKPTSNCDIPVEYKVTNYYETYEGCDDYLFQIDPDYNLTTVSNNFNKIKTFSQNVDQIVYFMPVPRSSYVHADKLQSSVTNVWNENAIDTLLKFETDNLKIIDVRKNLIKHNDEYIYFKTDHHWTQRGAYYAFEVLMEKLDIPYTPKDEITTLAEGFFGTYANYMYSTADRKIKDSDYIENYTVEPTPLIYKTSKTNVYLTNDTYLKRSLKYDYFDHYGQTDFSYKGTNNNNRNLLLIKDSYASVMYPFLTEAFSNIHVIDLNVNIETDSLYTFIDKYEITDIVFLYSTPTLLTKTFFNIR